MQMTNYSTFAFFCCFSVTSCGSFDEDEDVFIIYGEKERKRSSLTVFHLCTTKNEIRKIQGSQRPSVVFCYGLSTYSLSSSLIFLTIFLFFHSSSSDLITEVVHVYKLLLEQTWR